MKRPAAEVQLLALMSAYGTNIKLVEELIREIKEDAVQADRAYKQETTNLHNAIDGAIEGLAEVLYNLRNS